MPENRKEAPQAESVDIRALFEAQRSGVTVSTTGHVTRILAEDNKDSRHLKFLIDVLRGLSLLVAYNVDLASCIPLSVNGDVTIFGQYEWTDKGGLLHWTHHDPSGDHVGRCR